jgi:hypothetical protein
LTVDVIISVDYKMLPTELVHELNYSTFANSYLIILPNKKSVLYLQLRNRYFGNVCFGTKIEAYEIF